MKVPGWYMRVSMLAKVIHSNEHSVQCRSFPLICTRKSKYLGNLLHTIISDGSCTAVRQIANVRGIFPYVNPKYQDIPCVNPKFKKFPRGTSPLYFSFFAPQFREFMEYRYSANSQNNVELFREFTE